jgi:hypothetical protein
VPNRSDINRDSDSIFRKYYFDQPFVDRFHTSPEGAIDVLVPVMHTNELWETNLLSFYREIPIHKLLIGDGGCIDDSLEIARKFPRVTIYDHRSYKSLGYSVRKLIEAVETEWFIYLHSDVYLPEGWFDVMERHQTEYDWFGSAMQHTVLVEYPVDYGERPWAGSQMGRKMAFQEGLRKVDDDYVYRQEDFVFVSIVRQAGFKEGRVKDTFHYHQTMLRPSRWFRKIKSMKIDLEMTPEEELRTWTMELRGTIKYLNPSIPWAVSEVQASLFRLLEMNELNWSEFRRWVAKVNPVWLPYVSRHVLLKKQLGDFIRATYHAIVE